MASSVAKKTDTTAPAPPRDVLPIPLKNYTIEFTGVNKKWAYVTLPPGTSFQDLNDCPEQWRIIQDNVNIALQFGDRVTVFEHEHKFGVDAVVTRVGKRIGPAGEHWGAVTLGNYQKFDIPERSDGLYEDDLYRCEYRGSHVVVVRKSDNVLMFGQTFGTPDAAKQELLTNLYTRQRITA